MKKLLFFFAFLAVAVSTYAQYPAEDFGYGHIMQRIVPRKALHVPHKNSLTLDDTGTGIDSLPQVFIIGTTFVYYANGAYYTLSGGTVVDTASIIARLNGKLNISDTASMLSVYLTKDAAAMIYYPLTNPSHFIANITDLLNQGEGVSLTGEGISGDPYVLASPLRMLDSSVLIENTGQPDSLRYISMPISQVNGNIIKRFADGVYAANGTSANFQLLRGGIVTYSGTGLIYDVSAADYTINFIPYSSPATTITLTAADGTLNRIDVFTLTDGGIAGLVTGTLATNPVRPTPDAAHAFEISFATVSAGQTTATVNSECAYTDNISPDWAVVVSNARINPNGVTNVCSGTKTILGSLVRNGDNFKLTHPGGTFNPLDSFTSLLFDLKIVAAWGANKSIRAQFRNGTTNVGSAVVYQNGALGISGTNTASCQHIATALSQFALPAAAVVDNIIFTAVETGGNFSWAIDKICFQGGVPQTGPPTGNFVQNILGTPSITSDIYANRPAFGVAGRLYIAVDSNKIYRDTGAGWVDLGSKPNFIGDMRGAYTSNTFTDTTYGLLGKKIPPFIKNTYLHYTDADTLAWDSAHVTTFYHYYGYAGNKMVIPSDKKVYVQKLRDSSGNSTHVLQTSDSGLVIYSDPVSGNNIYNINGSLAGSRILTGSNTHYLQFDSLAGFSITNHGTTWFKYNDNTNANYNQIGMGDVNFSEFGTQVFVDDGAQHIQEIATSGMLLVLNNFGTSNRIWLRTQNGFTGNNNIYLPPYNSGTDTLATLGNLRAGISGLGSQTLDQTLGFGDTSFNHSMAFKDGAGQLTAFIEPSAKLITLGNSGDMGAFLQIDGSDSNFLIQAYKGVSFLGNTFGGTIKLLTQAGGAADNIYFPATGNANDTLATLADIEAGGYTPIPTIDAVLGAGNTATNKSFIMLGTASNIIADIEPNGNSPILDFGDVGFATHKTYFEISDPNSDMTAQAYNGINLILNATANNSHLVSQAAQTSAQTLALPFTGNVTDTLATLSSIRTVVNPTSPHTLYNHDDTLSSNRIVQGNGHFLYGLGLTEFQWVAGNAAGSAYSWGSDSTMRMFTQNAATTQQAQFILNPNRFRLYNHNTSGHSASEVLTLLNPATGDVDYQPATTAFGGSFIQNQTAAQQTAAYWVSGPQLFLGASKTYSSTDPTFLMTRLIDSTVNISSHGFVDANTVRKNNNNAYASFDVYTLLYGSAVNHNVGFQYRPGLESGLHIKFTYGLFSAPNYFGATTDTAYGAFIGDNVFQSGVNVVHKNVGLHIDPLSTGGTNTAIETFGADSVNLNGPVKIHAAFPALTLQDEYAGFPGMKFNRNGVIEAAIYTESAASDSSLVLGPFGAGGGWGAKEDRISLVDGAISISQANNNSFFNIRDQHQAGTNKKYYESFIPFNAGDSFGTVVLTMGGSFVLGSNDTTGAYRLKVFGNSYFRDNLVWKNAPLQGTLTGDSSVYWNPSTLQLEIGAKAVSGGGTTYTADETTLHLVTTTFSIKSTYPGQTSITTLGTTTTGTWQATKIGLAYGGTNADLSATGGAANYLKQASSGAAVTVGTIPESDLTFTNITTNNVSTTKHGYTPILPNDATKYLDGTGVWSIPPGTGGGISYTADETTLHLGTGVFSIKSTYVGQASLTTLGTITTGVWNGTKIGLAYGGTNADLSATGGAGQFLRQSSSGANVTVSAIAAADLPVTTTSSNGVSTVDGQTIQVASGVISAYSDWDILRAALGSTLLFETSWKMKDISTSSTMVTNDSYFIPILIWKQATLTGVKYQQGTSGIYTANNTNQLGLYSQASGTLTLVANSADDGAMWKATTLSTVAKAFTGTYNASPGVYYVGVCWNASATTTAPTLGAAAPYTGGNASPLDFTNNNKISCLKTATNALPSSVTMSTTTNSSLKFWFGVY